MAQLPKPQQLIDIRPPRATAFSGIPKRVNLMPPRRVVRIPSLHPLRVAIITVLIGAMMFSSAHAPTTILLAAGTASAPKSIEAERAKLEAQLQQLEEQIDHYERQVVGYQKQSRSLKGEIARLNSKIAKLNLQVKAINLSLAELDEKIQETESQIGVTEENIRASKQSLAELIRDVQRGDQTSLIEIFLKNPRLSDFFGNLNNIALLQSNLQASLARVTSLYEQLNEQKTQLSLARADAASIKKYREAQKKEAERLASKKRELLRRTKGEESKYKALLETTKATAAQIRNRIFQLLGGGELTFEQAYKFAKLAGKMTGIRPTLILSVLDRESALGRNVGKCNYRSAMNPKPKRQADGSYRSDVEIFLEITRKLGLNPDSVKVSCPNSDGVYGGAMGPAQFLPSTWRIYEPEIAQLTGKSVPSPWSNADAFIATALYLRDAYHSKSCRRYSRKVPSQAQRLLERCAAAKYYAGGSWYYYRWAYGEPVVERADRFQRDVAILEQGKS